MVVSNQTKGCGMVTDNWIKRLMTFFRSGKITTNSKVESSSFNKPIDGMQIELWLKTIDELQNFASKLQNELADLNSEQFEWSLLGAATYLYHIDRLCVKVREHFLCLRYFVSYREKNSTFFDAIEYVQASQACLDCYFSLSNVLALLKKLPKNRLHSEILVNQIHALELESVGASTALKTLSQEAFCSQTSFNSIEYSNQGMIRLQDKPIIIATSKHTLQRNQPPSRLEALKKGFLNFPLKERTFLLLLLEIHNNLENCYVIKRKQVVSKSLEQYLNCLEHILNFSLKNGNLLSDCKEDIICIYHILQSLRFCANHSSRCSENLADKAKISMQQFKNACFEFEEGASLMHQIIAKKKANEH